MPWIRLVRPEDATGKRARLYAAATKRAGRVYHIVRAMSPAPQVMKSSFDLYRDVMFAAEGLRRDQREMLAVVVSVANDCHY